MGRSVYRQFSLAARSAVGNNVRPVRPVFRPAAGRGIVLGLLLLVALGPAGARAAADDIEGAGRGFQVLSSGPEALSFSFRNLEPVWTPRTVGDPQVTLYDVSVDGFISSGEPGHARLPRTGGWVVVPPGTRPEIRSLQEQWQPAGDRPLMVEAVPVVIEGDEPWENSVSEILVLPGDDPPAEAPIPAAARESLARRGRGLSTAAATLGEVVWWRGRRIVSYQVTPIRQGAPGVAAQYLTSGSWEIRFVPDNSAGKSLSGDHARKLSTRNDDRFGSIFLNPELLTQVPAEAAWQGLDVTAGQEAEKSAVQQVRGQKAGSLLGPETRLAVWKTGLVRVTYDRLKSRGLIPDGVIREDQIRVYQRRYNAALDDGSGQAPYVEIEVPIHMVGEGDDFDGDDFFVFYGLRSRDDTDYEADLGNGTVTVSGAGDTREMNNHGNVYWLAASEPDAGSPWSRIATTTLPAATLPPLANYRRFDHIEENEAFRENVPTEDVDRLYYNTYRATDARAGINPLWAPDPAGTPVDIRLSVAGYSDSPWVLRFDLVTNSSTTTHLEDYNIHRIEEVQRTYQVPASAIDGDFAEIRMFIANVPPGIFKVYSFLNWVEISYDALYQATNNRLTFHCGTDPGPRPIEVTGFSSADIGLFEVTDPRNPVLVQLGPDNVKTTDNLSWTLSVMPDQSGVPRTFASAGNFTTDGVDEFPSHLSSVALDPSSPLDTGGTDPDMVVISHPDFIPPLGRWIDHRKSRAGGDLDIHVVDVNDIFDWYSGGMRDPWAIKRFMNHAITRWNSWALTIVGDANENSLEKGVISTARGWSKDWVPTHYHVQYLDSFGFLPELMASDKWYTTLESGQNYPQDNFPQDVFGPWEMYTGRFPCNSVAELDIMIDKVLTVENMGEDQAWRRRGIFFADDQWSNGYGAGARDTLVYKSNETVFATSERDSLARMWRRGSPVALDSVLVLLQDSLDPVMPEYGDPPAPRDLSDTRRMTSAVCTPILISELSQGGLVAHYQGHANPYVLSSEFWLQDQNDGVARLDVAKLGNTDKPWFFMGLGCHVTDWAQNTVLETTQPHERSISEKFLVKSRSGASAVYGSSGYEYITENKVFGEYIFRRWLVKPPAQRSVGTARDIRSRWVTGELMWAAEADIYAVNRGAFVQEMVAQYVLMGDPLMGLDAGGPQVAATLVGPVEEDIVDEIDVYALDGTNVRTVRLACADEAGIDRVQVVDSGGSDLTPGMSITETLPAGATNHQRVEYSLEVPVRPFAHDLIVRVYDTGGALETDRHYEVVLHLPQTAEFILGGSPIDPATFVFPADTPLGFSARVTSAAWLLGYDPTTDFQLESRNGTLALTDVNFLLDKNQHLTVNFTATAAEEDPDAEHVVVLTIDGYPTDLVLQQGTGAATSETIGQVYNYPNPMRDSTRFVFETGLAANEGIIRVYSVAGRPVARIPFVFTGGGSGIVEWDGRDSAGDEMGNGTYLYRVEIETNKGRVVSDMQRLVMMR